MRLLNEQTGELIQPRGKATNKCDYCATLAALENSEMLALDALMGVAPTVYAVTTTSKTLQDTRKYRRVVDDFVVALRRRLPALEYGCLIEFTTGRGRTSGGKRRPHWNWFFKGVGEEDLTLIWEAIEAVWLPRMNAARAAQYVGMIENQGGLLRYLAMHFQKQEQRPPDGWRGHRLRLSRGYLCEPTPVMREKAQASIRLRRELWKARQQGFDGVDAEAIAAAALEFQRQQTWRAFTWAEYVELIDKRPWLRTEPERRIEA